MDYDVIMSFPCSKKMDCYIIHNYRSLVKIRPPFLHHSSMNKMGVGVYTRITKFDNTPTASISYASYTTPILIATTDSEHTQCCQGGFILEIK